MNYLDLVKRLAVETGVELEAKITTTAVPPAVSYGSSKENTTRLIKWIQEAWNDIQLDQENWNFMVDRVQVDIAKGQISYEIGALVDAKVGSTVYDYIIPFVATLDYRYIWLVQGAASPVTRNKCFFVPPEQFFGERDRYSDNSRGLPSRYSIDRKGCLVFDTIPDQDTYYLEFEFKRLPQVLTEDADIPLFKEQHHMLIVYTAMTDYAGFDESGTQYQRAEKRRKNKMNKLRLTELRDYSMPGTRT